MCIISYTLAYQVSAYQPLLRTFKKINFLHFADEEMKFREARTLAQSLTASK